MTSSQVEAIADAVLYEGYNLYPYRPSAVKNRQRWTFGVLYPRPCCQRQAGCDHWRLQTECLVMGGADTVVEARVRFLHLADRTVGRTAKDVAAASDITVHDGLHFRQVESLEMDGAIYHAWQEAEPREAWAAAAAADSAHASRARPLEFAGHSRHELLTDSGGNVAGVVERRQLSIAAEMVISSRQLRHDVFMITVRVANLTPGDGSSDDRDEALLRSLVSTHLILTAREGEFVSLLEPPDELHELAAGCRNVGVWPVLVGEPGARDTMLSAPIILYDYPRVAAESPGDFFDGTEVDELLSLRIQTLTDEEKRQMRAVDRRTRKLLERTESLSGHDMSQLHGACRDGPGRGRSQPGRATVSVSGAELGPGSRVKLRPRGRADAFDILLRGRTATIESIERDWENTVYFAVTVDDDPGRDLGRQSQVAHRFFFRMDEVEPLAPEPRRS